MSQFQTSIGDESETGSTVGESSKSRRRSLVWLHFGIVNDEVQEGVKWAVCRHCSMKFATGNNNGTTHLRRHIKSGCKEIDEEEKERFKLGKDGDLFGSSYSFNPELTRNLMTLLFIDAEMPFNVIESRFWKPAMRSLRPEYRSIGRQTLRNDCVRVFQTGKELALQEFEGLNSRVCFTSDIWTSSLHLGYLCLTAHYIDTDFNFRKKIIGFKQIPYPHSGANVAGLMKDILIDWKLDGKIFTITLDNCTVNDNAIGDIEREFRDRTIVEGKHMHMRCAAHILNIMVQDGMKIIEPYLVTIRELMKNICASGRKLQMFNGILKDLNLPSKRGMILDCPTRWNSTYEMVNEALKYKEALSRFGNDVRMVVPTPEKWKEAEEMARFLEVFLDATKIFSTVRRPSSNQYMKEVFSIRSALLEEVASSNTTMQNLSKEMQKKFDKYWENPNLILTLACVFDPRRKFLFVEFCFEDAYGENTVEYNERVRDVGSLLRKFYDEYERTNENMERVSTSGSPQVESRILVKRKLDERFSRFNDKNRAVQRNKIELDNYLEEPVLVVSDEEDFDILQYWKRNSEKWPTLARMARDFLAVPVSTVASESAFSAAGRLTDNLRSSMHSDTLEALVCTKDWFASFDGSFNLDDFRPFMRRP